jgi:hypothetical protein
MLTDREEFGRQGRILSAMAAPDRGPGGGRDFAHPARRHTQVLGFQGHGDSTPRAKHTLQRARELPADPFLYGKCLQETRTNRVSLEMRMMFSCAMDPM